MQTTIDAAGRIVVPKALRDAMGLGPGREVDIVYTDGRLEIEVVPLESSVSIEGGLPIVRATAEPGPLDDTTVRATVQSTRR